MHEVITLSFSQRSNCIATHLFNVAESRLQTLNDDQTDSSVLLESRPGQFGNTVNYYPRALLWEYNNGFGSLNPSEYFESKPDIDTLKKMYPNVVTTSESIRKNNYQKALDLGTKTKGLADSSNMKCWSDYSRVIYRPESLLKLNRWEYSFEDCKGHLRSHPEIQFKTYDVGVDEFAEKDQTTGVEAIEENFRKVLEDCDTLNGLNVIAEGDSAWGGFSSECLAMIRDEYISKSPIVTWSLTDDLSWRNLPPSDRISRIKTLRSLSSVSSLYIPLSTEPSIAKTNQKASSWVISSYQSVMVDSMMALLSQKKNRLSMSDFVGGLTRGNEERKIVTLSTIDNHIMSPGSIFDSRERKHHQKKHTFAKSVISRSSSKKGEFTEDELKKVCGFDELINNGTNRLNLKSYIDVECFANQLDSFPEEFRKQDFRWCSFEVTNKPQSCLGEMAGYFSRYYKNDEREELKDDLYSMQEQYLWEDEDSDTDYE